MRKQTIVHHLFCAPQAFLGGLEDQVERAIEAAPLGQVFGGGQQHRSVTVVPTSMHDACVAAGVGQAGGFLDRQRIHVGTQADGFAGASAPQLPHHARPAESALDLVAPLLQALRNQIAGTELLVPQLGVAMDIAAHRGEFSGKCLQVSECGSHPCVSTSALTAAAG